MNVDYTLTPEWVTQQHTQSAVEIRRVLQRRLTAIRIAVRNWRRRKLFIGTFVLSKIRAKSVWHLMSRLGAAPAQADIAVRNDPLGFRWPLSVSTLLSIPMHLYIPSCPPVVKTTGVMGTECYRNGKSNVSLTFVVQTQSSFSSDRHCRAK